VCIAVARRDSIPHKGRDNDRLGAQVARELHSCGTQMASLDLEHERLALLRARDKDVYNHLHGIAGVRALQRLGQLEASPVRPAYIASALADTTLGRSQVAPSTRPNMVQSELVTTRKRTRCDSGQILATNRSIHWRVSVRYPSGVSLPKSV